MKAIVYTKYGPPDVLHLTDIEKPLPKDDEILIKVYATSVNFGDMMARNFKAISPRQFNMLFPIWLMAKISFGLNQPKITVLGNEFAGKVEVVGKNVKKFRLDDQVFGYTGERMGTYAEYICMPENGMLAMKPAKMDYEEAAVVPYGALMAFSLLRKVNIQPGQKILINGASGGIGSAAVQIAKSYGAEVSGVCSTQKVEFVRALGADTVIDYKKEDFTQNGETYDLIFDILGRSSYLHCKNSLKPNGIHLFASFKLKQLLQMLWTSRSRGQKVICALGPGSVDDLNSIKALIEAGKFKAVIDRCFPLEQIVDAHSYVEHGQKMGNVVITVEHKGKRQPLALVELAL